MLKEMARGHLATYRAKLSTIRDQAFDNFASLRAEIHKNSAAVKDRLLEKRAPLKAELLDLQTDLARGQQRLAELASLGSREELPVADRNAVAVARDSAEEFLLDAKVRAKDLERQLAARDEEAITLLAAEEKRDIRRQEDKEEEFRHQYTKVEELLVRLEASLDDESSGLSNMLVELSADCASKPELAEERVKEMLSLDIGPLEDVIKAYDAVAQRWAASGSTVAATEDGKAGQQEGEGEGEREGAGATTTAGD